MLSISATYLLLDPLGFIHLVSGFGKVVLAEEIDSVFDRMQGKFVPVVMYVRLREEKIESSAQQMVTTSDVIDANNNRASEIKAPTDSDN